MEDSSPAGAVTAYGLDGIDFDDEYADSGTNGTNGTAQPNACSFPYLVRALRNDLPDSDVSRHLSSFTEPLYGSDAVHTGSKP